jgi:organic radical activating enzyme
MQQGQWPEDGCQYCRNIEIAGGMSDRMFQNQIPDLYPSELDQDPSLTSVFPSVLEVFFSNTCNLGCVYCTPALSSTLQQEAARFGGALIQRDDIKRESNHYADLVPKFWNWFAQHGSRLQRLQVLGGEPFLQPDIDQLMDHFDRQDFSHLEFNLVTNLSVPERVIRPRLDRLRDLVQQGKLKRVDIQTSIDCWGTSQSYIRYKIDLDLFENNLRYLMNQEGAFRIGLLSTVNNLSIHHMPALAAKYQEWSLKQKLYWYMHLVLPPVTSVFSPMMFDYSVFADSMQTTRDLLPTSDDWDDAMLRNTFDGIDKTLQRSCQHQIDRQRDLVAFLERNDQRRNLNWRQEFPWLNHVVGSHNVV